MTLVRRVARPLLAAVFVSAGIDVLRNPAPRLAMARPFLEKASPLLAKAGLPDDDLMLVRANAVAQIAGGAMLAVGPLSRVGATILVGSVIPTTLAGHPFWTKEDPKERSAQRLQFLKNLGLLGGLLLAAVDTDGKPGLAWRAQHLAASTSKEARRAAATARREARVKVLETQNALS